VGAWLARYNPEWDQQPSPFIPAGAKNGRIADELPGSLHIEDPFSQGYNIARNSWKWMQAVSLFQVRVR
jgi:hypothetical protein